MKLRTRILLLGGAMGGLANTTPDLAPPPAWVTPIGLPTASVQGDAPIRLLLSDEQVEFERGSIARYSHVALLIQTSAGLSVGNVAMPWRPDVDTLTVHALRIRRGAKVIDVLADQKFTVLRRETNLEAATLDGRLTASLQVDGLEVGDVLELEQTVVSRDPTLGSHVEDMAAQWNMLGIDRARTRMHWAPDVPLQVRASASLPPVKIISGPDGKSLELNSLNVKPLVLARDAPARFGIGRLLESSDYTSWSQLAALLAPLFTKAARIAPNGPLAAQVATIRAASSDPAVRAALALALVQGKIRYVALQMGAGGYVPANADATWASRFGDCKAKTAMLTAMLNDLGIAAVPVAVASQGGDAVAGRLPMIGLFDHVLVRATIAGKEYWLDGTRANDRTLASLAVPDFRWGLPLVASGSQLVAIRAVPPAEPDNDYQLSIDASTGIFAPAKAHADVQFRGDPGEGVRQSMAALADANRDAALREYFRGLYDFIEPTTVSASFDPATGTERLSMDGLATLKWKDGFLRIPGSSLAYAADYSRPAGPAADAPFAIDGTSFGRATATVKVPTGVNLWSGKVGNDIDQTLVGIHYQRIASLKDGVLRMTKVERAVTNEVAAADARAGQARLRAINDEDVYLKTSNYLASDADLKALSATPPATGAAYLERGLLYFRREKWPEAIADLSKANEADPKDAEPLANRGLAYFWSGQFDKADADLAAAAAIDPNNAVILRGRGLVAAKNNDTKGAIAAFTASLVRDPDNVFALQQRASLHYANGEPDRALEDTEALLKIDPKQVDAYLLRANIFRSKGQKEQTLSQADSLLKIVPGNTMAAVTAARIYGAYQQTEKAMALMNAAIAREPSALLYLNRSYSRAKTDLAGRRGDLDSALKLEPKDQDALFARAEIAVEQKEFAAAIADYSKIYETEPTLKWAMVSRGVAYWKSGDRIAARRDLTLADKGSTTAQELNSMCWQLATSDVALDYALAACNRAIALAPTNASYLDSRGMVKLRLGQLDAAIADYDAALRVAPSLGASLYGRAIAWSRKGNREKAETDRLAAIKVSQTIADHFKDYGLSLP